MALKKPTQKHLDCPAQSYGSLERAIGEISENLARLTARLVGDDKLQTPGLISDFSAIKAKQEVQDASIAHTAEILSKLQARMEAYDEFRQRQEATNKEIAAIKERVDSASNLLNGGWKTLSVLATIVVGAGGFIGWVLKAWLTAKP